MGADLRIMQLYQKENDFFHIVKTVCFLLADCKGLEFDLSSHKQHPLWRITEERHPSSITLLRLCKDNSSAA